MSQKNFFEKLVPQSTYRKTNHENEKNQQNYINLKLPSLKKLNQKEKKAIKNLISEKREEIMLALLPEKLISTAKKDGYLEHLFKKLEI